MIIATIDGNIAAGKTTILDELRLMDWGNKKVLFLGELIPKDLEKYYNDKKNHAAKIELEFQKSRIAQLVAAMKLLPDIIIVDRSLVGNYVFTINAFLNATITMQELAKIWNLTAPFFPTDVVSFFVPTKPKVCMERIKARGRPGEEKIQKKYLSALDKLNRLTFKSSIRVKTSKEIYDYLN